MTDKDLLLTDEEIRRIPCQLNETRLDDYKTVAKAQIAKCQEHYDNRIAYLQDMVEQAKAKAYREIREWLSTHWKDIDADTVTYWCKDIATLQSGKKP
jgi:hypothetical protein